MIPGTEEIKQLEQDLRSKSEERRKEAYRRVLELQDSIAPTLVRWLNESNPDLRQAAYNSLRLHAGTRVADALIQKLSEITDPYLSGRFMLQAISILEITPDPRVPEVLTRLLHSENQQVVIRAVAALKRIADNNPGYGLSGSGKQAIAELLLKQLYDSSRKNGAAPSERSVHILALGSIGLLFLVLLPSLIQGESEGYLIATVGVTIIFLIWLSLLTVSEWFNAMDRRGQQHLRAQVLRTLRSYADQKAIPVVITNALNPRLARSARATLSTLLEGLKEDPGIELSEDQMNALLSFLRGNNRRLRTAILRAMPYIATEEALAAVEALQKDEQVRLSLEERRLLLRILPVVRERIERLKAQRILLRAAEEPDAQTLMRPADYHPELPDEQLLRAADNGSKEEG